ncbi:MAG: serine/threonine protein kinase [Myxococcales bacterium]|nr:serine/threonine protein kinase [Myxococcales bacterium]MCB9735391.1 serine/threonine protein kinase [Deltaproteobacteria bacterium]
MPGDVHEPRVLDREYELQTRLGRGGAAVVVKARQRSLGRAVALKVLSKELSPRQERLFFEEATRLAALDHPNIVTIHDFGVLGASRRPCLVMQLVSGRDLAQLLAEEGPLAPARAVGLVAQACDALAYSHAAGLVHRDIKPANLLVTDTGDREHVLVADFGVARDTSKRGESSVIGVVSGTPAWMSPEQCAGEASGVTSDVYSLALVLYALLTGRNPFERANPAAAMNAQLGPRPASPDEVRPEVSRALSRVVMSALAASPSARPQSARALKDLLLASLEGPESRPTQAGARRAPSDVTLDAQPAERTVAAPAVAEAAFSTVPRSKRWSHRATLGVALVLAVLVVGAVLVARHLVSTELDALPQFPFREELLDELAVLGTRGNLPWGASWDTVRRKLGPQWMEATKLDYGDRGLRRVWYRPKNGASGEDTPETLLLFRGVRLAGLYIRFFDTETRESLSTALERRFGREPDEQRTSRLGNAERPLLEWRQGRLSWFVHTYCGDGCWAALQIASDSRVFLDSHVGK